ncbi:type II toxin-antitoxin system RelE/ParE family toxin [Mucilaginibacter sp.]
MEVYEVRWTPEAETTFDTIIKFINAGWGEFATERFLSKTEKLLAALTLQPSGFPEPIIHQVRKAVVTKNLLYFMKFRSIKLFCFSFGITGRIL